MNGVYEAFRISASLLMNSAAYVGTYGVPTEYRSGPCNVTIQGPDRYSVGTPYTGCKVVTFSLKSVLAWIDVSLTFLSKQAQKHAREEH